MKQLGLLMMVAVVVAMVTACAGRDARQAADDELAEMHTVAIASPAATYCEAQGYEVLSAGTQLNTIYYCVDRNSGRKCPVWKFHRGECQLSDSSSRPGVVEEK